MDKENTYRICNFISITLTVIFAVKSGIDYLQYSSIHNSAPFYLWILVNALYFIIPAIIIFIIGNIIRKRH